MKLENHIKTTNGFDYTFLGVNENDIGSFKFRNVIRKYKLLMFAGVQTAVNMNGPLIYSGKKDLYDEEIDGIMLEKIVLLNKNGESYVNVFKRHQEEKVCP